VLAWLCSCIATAVIRAFELIVTLLQIAVIRPPPPHEVAVAFRQ